MIYADVPLKEWLEKTGLIVEEFTCNGCGCVFKTDTPAYIADCYALVTKDHGCGKNGPAILTPKTKAGKEFWNEVLS